MHGISLKHARLLLAAAKHSSVTGAAAAINRSQTSVTKSLHDLERDVGVDGRGRTVSVEANDGRSTGDYGLAPLTYARFLEARWCELTGAAPIA